LKAKYAKEDKFRVSIRTLLATAFLPVGEVQETVQELRKSMPEQAAPFIDYFCATYVVGKELRKIKGILFIALNIGPTLRIVHIFCRSQCVCETKVFFGRMELLPPC